MIIVKLSGGLGNQIFQYAAGRFLSHIHNVDLLLDLSYLNKNPNGAYTKRDFELNVFNIQVKIATENDIEKFNISNSSKISRELQRRFPEFFKYLYAAESGLGYQAQFKKYGNNTYLDGFWQSEKYFIDIRDLLLKDFISKSSLSIQVSQLKELINNSNSVSLHVRRGDYVSSKQNLSTHGVLSPEYYQNAINLINQVNPENIFVFSDDVNWCKENLILNSIANIIFVQFNDVVPNYQEMILMSCCKHNIIANSSFSWWAAWLNTNSQKKVVAPINWFQSQQNPDIYPEGWVKI